MTATNRPMPRPGFLRVLAALVLREMTTRYGRSWGGYVWALAEPLGAIALLTLVFSQMMRSPPIGSSFALFYASGYMAFQLFVDISNTTSSAIGVNRSILRYPSVTPLDAILSRFLLSLLTQVVAMTILFSGIILIFGVSVSLDPVKLSMAIAISALLGLGIGALNCVIFAFVPVWHQIWAVISRPLFLVSGIFYLVEDLPEHLRGIIWFNPLVHPVSLMRAGFYGSYDARSASPAYACLIGAVCLLLGLFLLRQNGGRILEQ
jgi:capsular polysaccharide transport system permease protein